MRTVSDQTIYDEIMAGYYRTQQQVIIGNDTYGSEDIVEMSADHVLFDDLTIGNAISAQMQVKLAGIQNISIGADIIIQQRVKNTEETSDWFTKGVFFVYKVDKDQNAKTTTVTGYDALYKSDATFMRTGTWTSQTTPTIVQMIATDIGVDIHADTESFLESNPLNIDYIPSISENGTTDRDMLSYIAVMYAGNWMIDEDGYLKLIRLINMG